MGNKKYIYNSKFFSPFILIKDKGKIQKIRKEFYKINHNNWHFDKTSGEQASQYTCTDFLLYIVFSFNRKNKKGEARLWLIYSEKELFDGYPHIFITNIISSEEGIDVVEHNNIAKSFYKEVMVTLANNLNLEHGETMNGKHRTSIESTSNTDPNPCYSIKEQINNISCQRPHLVILGAGATRATLPNGDKNGKTLPLMNDLIEILDLSKLITDCTSEVPNNFEVFYSSIHKEKSDLSKQIERKIYEYFSSVQIPDKPTIYDYLIFCLREKDVIATFNWDPILDQALERSATYFKNKCREFRLPQILHLHGNVSIGYCIDCQTKGSIMTLCHKCNKPRRKSQLLYPVSEKNYKLDAYIEQNWKAVQKVFEQAYIVTIFGYSKPTSDAKAITLFKNAWGTQEDRDLEEFEIINTENTVESWEEFIHTHHFEYTNNFFESKIARFPRRSCECEWERLMECKFFDGNPIKNRSSFKELYDFMEPLIKRELEK